MKDSLDVVMEALHQDMFFQTTYIANQEYYLSAVLYQLGNDQLDTLGKFLYEDGLIPMGKHIVFDAIIMTALHQPQQRLTALHIASEYLNHCIDICKQGANPMNIDFYALSVASAHFQIFMPQLKQLYKEVEIPPYIFENGISQIEEIMNNENITFQKSGKYGPNNEHQIALIDARGTYPLKSMKSMAEYVDRLKEGKIRQPNFSTVRNNIRQFEEDNKLPF